MLQTGSSHKGQYTWARGQRSELWGPPVCRDQENEEEPARGYLWFSPRTKKEAISPLHPYVRNSVGGGRGLGGWKGSKARLQWSQERTGSGFPENCSGFVLFS